MSVATVVVDSLIVCVLAFVYSLMEIEMEGAYGWAQKLPTTKNVFGSFTLYHLYMLGFLLLLFGGWFFSRFVGGWVSGWTSVFQFGFFMILWLLIEDFLWFVYNPHYTIKRYTKDNIAWHKNWVGPIPMHNITGLIGLVLICIFEGSFSLFYGLVIGLLFTLIATISSPLYHKLYRNTHKDHMLIHTFARKN